MRTVKKMANLEPGMLPKTGYAKARQIFTYNQENQLEEYILHCSRIYYGLAPKEIRKLAFQ